jgi:flagellar motor switch protein FliN
LLDQAGIDDILKQASFEDVPQGGAAASATAGGGAEAAAATATMAPPTEDFPLPNLQQVMQDAQVSSIDLLRDVDLNVKIELGRTRMLVEDVLKLGEGSVVELDKLAGDPVDVFVNERLVARGEVLVLNDNFCVRINEIVAGIRDEEL